MGSLPLVTAALASVVVLAGCSEAVPGAYLRTDGDRATTYATGPMDLGSARIRPEVCRGVPENRPDSTRLDEGALVSFLQRQGLHTRVTRARPDLVYVDVLDAGGPDPVRLRVAILGDAYAAGSDLHHALLQHGPGSWGVHRSNLAVLAPIGSLDQILELSGRTKLACWGVLTVAGRDDDFVVPGGYIEF